MHWMMAFYEPLDMEAVRFAKKLIKHPLFFEPELNYAHRIDDNYIIKPVMVDGYSVKDVKTEKGYEDKGAVFFKMDTGLIRLGESWYPPLRFSVPKSQLVKWETDELDIEQEIQITEWAYTNCYMLPINKIFENWGKCMKSWFSAYNNEMWETPMFKSSKYRELIEEYHRGEIRNMIQEYKKKGKFDEIFEENRNDNKPKVVHTQRNKEPFREEAEFIFYTDGSGNWADNKKYQDKGHYSVYLKNSQETWKRREDKLTSNQAEIKGVIAAVFIAIKRSYKKVSILTDSQNVIKWVLGRKEDFPTNIEAVSKNIWSTKDPEIEMLIDKLMELTEQVPHLSIKYISRDRNFAHAI